MSQLFIVFFMLFGFVLLYFIHFLAGGVLHGLHLLRVPVLVLNTKLSKRTVAGRVQGSSNVKCGVVKFLRSGGPGARCIDHCPVLNKFNSLRGMIQRADIRSILVTTPKLSRSTLSSLVCQTRFLIGSINIVPGLIKIPVSGVRTRSFFSTGVVILRVGGGLTEGSGRVIGELFSITTAVVNNVYVLPILFVITT